MTNEIWKIIEGSDGKYSASSNGRIKNNRNNYILKGSINGSGYFTTSIYYNGSTHNFLIHRLVIITFFGLQKDKHVNHKNGIKTDNRVENLEWVTQSYNAFHAFVNGFKQTTRKHVEITDVRTNKTEVFDSFKTVRKLFRLHPATINNAHLTGKIIKKKYKCKIL